MTSTCGARRRGKRSWSTCTGIRSSASWSGTRTTGHGAVGRSMREARVECCPSIRWDRGENRLKRVRERKAGRIRTLSADGKDAALQTQSSVEGEPPRLVSVDPVGWGERVIEEKTPTLQTTKVGHPAD